MNKQCDLQPSFKGEECPCCTCLVKVICVNTCKPWELYYKKVIHSMYKKYEPSDALDGHIHNKCERQRMMRLIKCAVEENACASIKF